MRTKSLKVVMAGGDCAEVRRRLTAWWAQRSPGERIPEELCEAAAGVARNEGVAATSRALRLSYYDLRRRVERQSVAAKRSSADSMFVEVARAPLTKEIASIGRAGEILDKTRELQIRRANAARSPVLMQTRERFLATVSAAFGIAGVCGTRVVHIGAAGEIVPPRCYSSISVVRCGGVGSDRRRTIPMRHETTFLGEVRS